MNRLFLILLFLSPILKSESEIYAQENNFSIQQEISSLQNLKSKNSDLYFETAIK